jgi:hypothetical protein
MIRTSLYFSLLVLLWASRSWAAEDPLLPLHLKANDLPGLSESGVTFFCGGGEDLTTLYDGGYERFAKAGVQAASRRYFVLDGGTAEMVMHKMKSEKDAQKFLVSLCGDLDAKVESTNGVKLCLATAASGSTFGNLVRGIYLVTASFDKTDINRFRELLKASGRLIDKVGKKSK